MYGSDSEKTGDHVSQVHAFGKAHDVEASAAAYAPDDGSSEEAAAGAAESRRAREIQGRTSVLRRLRRAEEWLDRTVGIEMRGVDRIPEAEKRPPSTWNIFLLWWSMNVHVGALPLGLLGPLFGLSLPLSVAATVLGNILGASCTAFTGTLGPKLGLRQCACARYSFGMWGAKLPAVLNVVNGGGWYVVNLIVVGEILSAVTDFNLSMTVGIVVVVVVSYVLSVFGFRLIHTYLKYSWIGTFVLMCVLVAQAAPHIDSSVPGRVGVSRLRMAGPFLTIVAINTSNTSGWCFLTSDYYCNYPASTSSWKVFGLTLAGMVTSTSFNVISGACIAHVAITQGTAPFAEAYKQHSVGGLLAAVYHPVGWAKFCLVMLMLSGVGVNVANDYSAGLALQLLGDHCHAVPRFVWSLLFAVVTTALALAGQDLLEPIIANFVSMLGYVSIPFTLILLLEDKVFRRRTGYQLSAWNQPRKLPPGVAAVGAMLAAYFAGGVPGMAQTWYVGPVAAEFGGAGGDCGNYLAAVITLVVYGAGRPLEKRLAGR